MDTMARNLETMKMENAPPSGKQCPKCHRPLAASSPEGLCPRCLLTPTEGKDQAVAEFPPIAEIARHFPNLEILEPIGGGGFGVVYKVRQPKLDRYAALKLIRPSLTDKPGFAERFQREAQALRDLKHPHIVDVYDFDVRDGMWYLLMEYVDGSSLRELLLAKELPPRRLEIVVQVCEALQFAHDKGVVHRDIKPENILIDAKGQVKIVDFGLIKWAMEGQQQLTMTGITMGTPYYMAPEQLANPSKVDHRADIYSLGVVLYELLTGDLPVGRWEAPSRKAAVDARLDAVVSRTLEREPERRYQRADEVKAAVAGMDTSAPRPAPVAPNRNIMRTINLVAGIIVTAIAGLVLLGVAGAVTFLALTIPAGGGVSLSMPVLMLLVPGIAVGAILLFSGLGLFRSARSQDPGRGWILPLVLVLLAFLALPFFAAVIAFFAMQYSNAEREQIAIIDERKAQEARAEMAYAESRQTIDSDVMVEAACGAGGQPGQTVSSQVNQVPGALAQEDSVEMLKRQQNQALDEQVVLMLRQWEKDIRARMGKDDHLKALAAKYPLVILHSRARYAEGGYRRSAYNFFLQTADENIHKNAVQIMFDNGDEGRAFNINMHGGSWNLIADLGAADFTKDPDLAHVNYMEFDTFGMLPIPACEGHVYLEHIRDHAKGDLHVLFQIVAMDPEGRYMAFLWRELPGTRNAAVVRPEYTVLKELKYQLDSRSSTGWVNGKDGKTRYSVDQALEWGSIPEWSVKAYLSLTGEILVTDATSGETLWQLDWNKSMPTWQTLAIVETEHDGDLVRLLELRPVNAKPEDRTQSRYFTIRDGQEIIFDTPPVRAQTANQ